MTHPTTIGRYEVIRELGRGAMGTVWLARDTALARLVALKTFRLPHREELDPEDSAVLRRRTLREAQRAGTLSHPNVVTIYDVVEAGPDESSFYIVMEYVEGQGLDARMRAEGPMKLSEVAPIVSQIASALDHLHARGIVHRDVKPGNVLITADGRLKITDFGIARTEDPSQTLDTDVYGTPYYMAPEQIQGGTVDARTDVFALGAVLYEMLTGSRAFPGSTVAEVAHRIVYGNPAEPRRDGRPLPATAQQVLQHALAKEPADRYPTAGALAAAVQDLAEIAGDLDATTAFPRGRWLVGSGPGAGGTMPRTWLVVAAVAVVLALLLGSGWAYLHYLRGSGPAAAYSELEARQVGFVKLLLEGKTLMADGDPQGAAVLFQAAEGMAIDPAEARRLREEAERRAEEEGAQLQLLDARADLEAGRYDQVVATAREMLETRAGREKAASVLAEVQEALTRGAREEPARHPVPTYSAAEAAPLPAATPETSPTIDYGVLHVELQSQSPKVILAFWIDDRERTRYPFEFYQRTAFFRKRPMPGSWSADFAVAAGAHALKVLLVRPGEAAHVSQLDAEVEAGALRTLAVFLPARGEPMVELR
jgi:tRNA A-37 threonylcarbamoyl transferase component Bud32